MQLIFIFKYWRMKNDPTETFPEQRGVSLKMPSSTYLTNAVFTSEINYRNYSDKVQDNQTHSVTDPHMTLRMFYKVCPHTAGQI